MVSMKYICVSNTSSPSSKSTRSTLCSRSASHHPPDTAPRYPFSVSDQRGHTAFLPLNDYTLEMSFVSTLARVVDFTHFPVKPVKALKGSAAPWRQPDLGRHLLPHTSTGPRKPCVSIAPYAILFTAQTRARETSQQPKLESQTQATGHPQSTQGCGAWSRFTHVRLTRAKITMAHLQKKCAMHEVIFHHTYIQYHPKAVSTPRSALHRGDTIQYESKNF